MKNRLLHIVGLVIMSALLFTTGCDDDDNVGPTVTVTTVNPTAAYGGDQVTIQGENFNTVKNIFVGDKHAEVVSSDQGSITFIVPTNAAPGPSLITLAMLNNYRVTAPLEVLLRPIPRIDAIHPSAAAPGEQVTLRGVNLDNLVSVTVGGAMADVVSATNTELVLTVPSGLPDNSPAEIEVATQEVTETSTSIFYVGTNNIVNSGFEDGSGDDFDNWEKLNGGDQMTEVTGDEAYFGRSVRIVGANNPDQPWRTQFASLGVPLNFGSEYTCIMWVRGEEEGAVMRISVSQYDGQGADYFYGEDMEIPTEWTQISWTFEVTNDLPTHRVVLDMGYTDIPFVIDNVALVETGAAGPPVAQNLIANGGFEDGLDAWEVLNGTSEVSTDDFNCGAQSVRVTPASGNPWDQQMASDGIQLTFGGQYEIRLWARADAEGGVMRVSVSQWDGNGADYFYGADAMLTTEWAEYSWTFEVTNDLPEHRLVLDMGAGAIPFYIDDVSLKEYREPMNILDDGGFESGLDFWEVLNGTIEVTTDADQVSAGSQAIKVTGAGGNPWDTQMAANAVPLTFNARYGIKLMAKAAGSDAVMRVSVSRWNNSNGDDYFYGADVTLTEEWAEYTWEFTVGKDIPDGHHVVLDMGASAQEFYIDDVVLYAIEDFMCP